MAKARLENFLTALGHSSTRLFIIDTISKNGNKINTEDLIDKAMAATKIQRQSIRKQLLRMIEKGELLKNGNEVSLVSPTEVIPLENPLESWTIIGIPLSLVFLLISLTQNNLFFQLASIVFTLYAVVIKTKDIVAFLKKIR